MELLKENQITPPLSLTHMSQLSQGHHVHNAMDQQLPIAGVTTEQECLLHQLTAKLCLRNSAQVLMLFVNNQFSTVNHTFRTALMTTSSKLIPESSIHHVVITLSLNLTKVHQTISLEVLTFMTLFATAVIIIAT